MKCPQCGHIETIIYGQTSKGSDRYICPMCHEIFTDKDRFDYTPPNINLITFRDFSDPDSISQLQEAVPTTKISASHHKKVAVSDLLVDFCIIILFTTAQCLWMSGFTSTKVGLVNLLPTFIFLSIWYFFTRAYFEKKYFWLCFSIGFILVLRLPLTLSRSFEPLNWGIYAIAVGLIFQRVVNYFKSEQKLILLVVTVALVLFNSFTHISLNSPFTYSFRLVLGQPSHYISGQDNNATWECPYDFTSKSSEIVVHCDMRHFIASEKIFTLPKYDASFAVFLNRFFYGYLSSLTGFEGHRWFASFILNIVFWILTCAAIFRICILTNLDQINQNISAIATLCCAISWGFVSFVAQPAPYLLAYTFTAVMIWMSLEIICNSQVNSQSSSRRLNLRELALYTIIMVAAPLTYELYPVAIACIIFLLIYRQFALSAMIVFGQILLPILWSKVFLARVLGTTGTPGGVTNNIPMSIKAWVDIFAHLNYSQALHFIGKGSLAFLYGGMIFGAIAAVVFIIYLFVQLRLQRSPWNTTDFQSHKIILILCSIFSILFFLAGIFIAPTAQFWSPTGMIPRFLYYTYVINTIALSAIASLVIKKYAYVVPVLTFLVANVSLFGIASVTFFSDYGVVGLYWK
jgi:hypothetical protein